MMMYNIRFLLKGVFVMTQTKKYLRQHHVFKRGFTILLAGIIALPTFVTTLHISSSEVYAATTPATLSAITTQGSQVAGSFQSVFNMTTDPDTSNVMKQGVFNDTKRDDGRIWLDKSVNTNQVSIFNVAGQAINSISANADEFLITLSALSQGWVDQTIIVEPSDTVFIIDTSGSMQKDPNGTSTTKGKTRIDLTIQALNKAIKTILNENPNNRISVVTFGGNNATNVLDLKSYAGISGDFFTVSYNSSGTPTTINVNSQITKSNGLLSSSSLSVTGGTPTQMGIKAGATVLLNNTDLTYSQTVTSGTTTTNKTVTRQPNIILMTDGDPTYGWKDYKMTGATSSNDMGNGTTPSDSTQNFSLYFNTVMTAAYMKQQVQNHYYGTDPTHSVGFFTIGLGVITKGILAAMDPYGITSGQTNASQMQVTYSGKTYNMETLLNNMAKAPATAITIPITGTGGKISSTLNVTNSTGITSFDYADLSFSATDDASLSDAFNQIASLIVSQGNYTTTTDANDPWAGDIVFSDALGSGMEFRQLKNLVYNGLLVSPATLSQLNNSDFWNLFASQTSTSATTKIDAATAQALVAANIAGKQTNSLKYYTDAYDYYLGSYYNADGSLSSVPSGAMAVVAWYTFSQATTDPVTGKPINLDLLAFQVITALNSGRFYESEYTVSFGFRDMAAGDQLVRWYVDQQLLPQRSVNYTDSKGNTLTTPQVNQALPIRMVYTVGLNQSAIANNITTSKTPMANTNATTYYTNKWQNPALTWAFFYPNTSNPFYFNVNDGSTFSGDMDRVIRSTTIPATEFTSSNKSANPTNSSALLYRLRNTRTADDPMLIYELGNNGAITVPMTQLNVIKEWDTLGTTTGTPWYSTIQQFLIALYGNNTMVGTPMNFTPTTTTAGVTDHLYWTNLPLYSLAPNSSGQVTYIDYTVQEGSIVNDTFTPFTPKGGSNDPNYDVVYFQPVLTTNDSGLTYTWSDAKITNIERVSFMILEKTFGGEINQSSANQTFQSSDPILFDVYVTKSGTPFKENYDMQLKFPNDFVNFKTLVSLKQYNDDYGELLDIKIVESNANLLHFTWTATASANSTPSGTLTSQSSVDEANNTATIVISGLTNGNVLNTTINNIYKSDPEFTQGLIVRKEIYGDLGWSDDHDITFLVEGWTDDVSAKNKIQDNFLDSWTLPWQGRLNGIATGMGNSNKGAGLNIGAIQRDIIPRGYYTLTEIGAGDSTKAGDVYNTVYAVSKKILVTTVDTESGKILSQDVDGTQGFWVDYGQSVTVTVQNTYTQTPTLSIIKTFNAYNDIGVPIDAGSLDLPYIEFHIQGLTTGVYMEIPYSTFINNQVNISNLPYDTYIITEISGAIPGYMGPIVSMSSTTTNLITGGETAKLQITAASPTVTDITFNNRYYKNPPPKATITVHKDFHGLLDDEIPAGFNISLSGRSTPFTLSDLQIDNGIANAQTKAYPFAGTYTITENNYLVDGYDVVTTATVTINGASTIFVLPVGINTFDFTLPDSLDNVTVDVVVSNIYTPKTATLTLVKEITGIDVTQTPISELTFLVVGWDSPQFNTQIYRRTFNFIGDFDANNTLVIKDLPAGYYQVFERGGLAPYYLVNLSVTGIGDTLPPKMVHTGNAQPPFSFPLKKGADDGFMLTNNYVALPPIPGSLTIQKVFHGLTDNEIKAMTAFSVDVAGPQFDTEPLSISATDLLNGFTTDYQNSGNNVDGGGEVVLKNLETGIYTISEQNTDVVNFDGPVINVTGTIIKNGQPQAIVNNMPVTVELTTQGALIPEISTPGDDPEQYEAGSAVVIIDNMYTKKPVTLEIYKTFVGLPSNAIVSEISFLIIGYDQGTEVYRQTVLYDGSYPMIVSGLPPATYTISERGGKLQGYAFTSEPASMNVDLTQPGTTGTASFTNTYTPIPEDTPYALNISKTIKGLDDISLLSNFSIVIMGPNNYNKTLTLNNVKDSFYLLENLAAGTYVVAEVNADVNGFTYVATPGEHVMITLPDDSGNNPVVVSFLNQYSITTTPTPTPPVIIVPNIPIDDDPDTDEPGEPHHPRPPHPPEVTPPPEQPPVDTTDIPPDSGSPDEPGDSGFTPPPFPETPQPPTTDPQDPHNPEHPPFPTEPGYTLVQDENGDWILLDENGVPLGRWVWDEDRNEWIFIEDAAAPTGMFAASPQTGDHRNFIIEIIIIATGFITMAAAVLLWRKKESSENTDK